MCLAGKPSVHAELDSDITPLEAGMAGMVALNKGCFMGQVSYICFIVFCVFYYFIFFLIYYCIFSPGIF